MTLSKQHTVVKSVIAHEYDNREQAKSSIGISGSRHAGTDVRGPRRDNQAVFSSDVVTVRHTPLQFVYVGTRTTERNPKLRRETLFSKW